MKNTIFNASIIGVNFDDCEIKENKKIFFQIINSVKSHIIVKMIYKKLSNEKKNQKRNMKLYMIDGFINFSTYFIFHLSYYN